LNVLSLFDGISCGRVALDRAHIKVDNYYASEIDKHAIAVSKDNWKDIIHIGDVTKVSFADGVLYTETGNHFVGKIDLVLGGSPCQSISNLGNKEGLEGKSGLFYHWLRIKNEVNPKYFLLENVVGKKSALEEISNLVGVEPIKICSSMFSAQKRNRLYWTNIKVSDKYPVYSPNLVDILEDYPGEESILTEGRLRWLLSDKGQQCIAKKYSNINPTKAACLTARSDASWNCNYIERDGKYRKLSCVEYERLQTLPDNYTKAVLPRERYKSIGNGWTVDVIVHILKGIVTEQEKVFLERVVSKDTIQLENVT